MSGGPPHPHPTHSGGRSAPPSANTSWNHLQIYTMAPVIKRKIHAYTEDALKEALTAIRVNKMGIREASRKYGVPRGTIQDRLHGRIKEGPRKMGPATILTSEEEMKLVKWITALATCGFPRKRHDLLNTVQQIVLSQERKTKFRDGRPGDKWYKSFLKRHPELTYKEAEGISMARGIITEESIRKWFMELKQFLTEANAADILDDPNRIFNGDETSFCMCPKTGKVLAPRGWKNVYDIKKGADKEAITVLMVFSASGKTVSPMVVFPYVRPPKNVVDSMPSEWFIGKSETGWMRSEVFFEYIANGFHNWLNEQNISRPVLLLIDGHKSHLTLELSQFCSDNKIYLYALPPNTTHIMQPADVGVFKPLKTEWKKTLRNWQSKPENTNSVLTKTTFCPLLSQVLESDISKAIRNGFRKCGLYPFDPDAVDYTKCVQNKLENIAVPTDNAVNDGTVEISLQDFQITENVLTKVQEKLKERYVNSEIETIINEVRTLREETFPATATATRPTIIESVTEIESYEVADGYELLDCKPHYNFTPDSEIRQGPTEKPRLVIIAMNPEEAEMKNKNEELTENEDDVKTTEGECAKIKILQNICIKGKQAHTQPMILDFKSSESDLDLNDETARLNLINEIEETVLLFEERADMNNAVKISVSEENHDIELNKNQESVESSDEKTEINNLQNISLQKGHGGPTEQDPFEKHLFWPSPLQSSSGKRKTSAEKAPAAISSESFRNYLRIKQEKKQKVEDEKQKRKAERLKRSTLNKMEKEKKKRNNKTKKKRDSVDEEEENPRENHTEMKENCAECFNEMDSDTEENDLKNVGCDKCPRWFHLKCTNFVGRLYEEIADQQFVCAFC